MRKGCSSRVFLFLFFFYWAVEVNADASAAPAPAPAVDCSDAILSLSDCLTFVEKGSKLKKPESTCCSALKEVVKTEVKCLCEAFKSSEQFGISLDIKKALSLPSACKVSTPSASNCKIGDLPGGSPAPSPSQFFSTAPSSSSGIPAPSPAPSSAPGLPLSVVTLLVSLAIAI